MADRTVRVRYEALIGAYEAALAKAGISTKSFGHTVDSVLKNSDKSFKSMALGLKDLGGGQVAAAAGAAVAGVALTKMARNGVKSYIELVDEVKAYRTVTGESVQESSRMVALARVLGVSTDTLANGMFRLAYNVDNNTAKLRADGIEIARNKQGHVDLSATLLNVADAWKANEDAGRRATIVRDAFGRGGLALAPILKQDREEIEKLWAEAAKHHEIVTEADVRNVFQYKVATRELHESILGLERGAGPGLVSGATKAATIGTKVAEAAPDVWDQVERGIPVLGAAARLLGHYAGASDKATASARQHAEAEQLRADKLKIAAAKVKELSDKLDNEFSVTFSVDSAQAKFTGDLTAFADKVRAAKEAGDKFATSLDESTTTGRVNAEMVRGLAKDIIDTAKTAAASGADVATATGAQRRAFADVLTQLGFTREQAQKYVDVLADIPTKVDTKIALDTTQAEQQLATFKRNIDALHGITEPASGSVAGAVAGQGPETDAERQRKADDVQRWNDAIAANAKSAKDTADAEDESRYRFGGLTVDQYKAILERRLAQTRQYSAEWTAIMQKIASVNDDIGRAWTAAADQIAANEQRWMDVLRMQHEFGELSTAEYLAQLKKRLAGLQQYTAEWESTRNEIKQIEGDLTQSEINIIQAVDKQRRFDQAFADTAYQRALSDVRAVSPFMGSSTVNNTRTNAPVIQIQGTGNTYGDVRTATQAARDDAFLAGV